MTQKELAKKIKKEFNTIYSIQGWNIYVKSDKDITDKIIDLLNKVNENENLGYKRFFVVPKENGRTKILSVPMGIAVIIN